MIENSILWASIYWVLPLSAGCICAFVAIYLSAHRRQRGAKPLMLAMAAVAWWSIAYAMEFRSATIEAKLLWVKAEYIGSSWVSFLCLILILAITGRKQWLTIGRVLFLAVIPFAIPLLAFTNSRHGLMWKTAWLDMSLSIPVMAYERGIGFWVFAGYSYALLVIGTVILLRSHHHSMGIYRRQLRIVILGIAVPWLSNALYLFGASPIPSLDLTPFAFTISGIIFCFGLFRYQLLEIVPIAREALLEAIGDAVLVMDFQDRIVEKNSQAHDLIKTGSVENISGKASEVLSAILSNVQRLKGEECNQAEIGLNSGSERKIYNLKVSPLLSRKDRLVGWLVCLQDITERKRSEEALRAAEETYRNLFLNSQIGLFRTDIKTGLILDANDAVAQLIGFKDRNKLMAESFNIAERYVDPEAREKMISLLKRDGEFRNYEARFRRNDGAILWMRYSARMVPEKGWVEGVSEDVTQEKLAELSLRKSEERFSRLFFSSPTWMAITRLEDGTYLEVNKAFETITGFDRKEVLGRTSQELGLIPDEFKRDRLMTKAKEEGGFREEEMVFTTRKGDTLTALWSADLIELAGVTCLFSTIMDITELKRSREEMTKLEDQLHRAQKMEALGLLAGGVAHDLNNILSGIVSYPELILMDLPEDSPLRKPIRTIHESGMRAAGVVADLLTIARGVAIGKETLNLNRIINEYLHAPEFTKLEKTHALVDFKTEGATDLLNIKGSPIHLKKVLMNLVVNATEAIEGKGVVNICTFNRYLDKPLSRGYEDVRRGEYAVLSISDDGSGISPEDVERIFEPFYTKKVMGRSGTGLGLAVVWNTVQDHSGYINVKTSEAGTTFELYFPVTREEIGEKREPAAVQEYMGHGENILVVDDEESQREIATEILTKLGYHAKAVPGGEEAIAYVKEHVVDLIVLDMVMPKGINGREAYEEIIKIRPGQKAIIASGYAQTEEVDAAQKLGAGKYIKKPYTLEKIGVAVKEELER